MHAACGSAKEGAQIRLACAHALEASAAEGACPAPEPEINPIELEPETAEEGGEETMVLDDPEAEE